jgi:hypothetical protein
MPRPTIASPSRFSQEHLGFAHGCSATGRAPPFLQRERRLLLIGSHGPRWQPVIGEHLSPG